MKKLVWGALIIFVGWGLYVSTSSETTQSISEPAAIEKSETSQPMESAETEIVNTDKAMVKVEETKDSYNQKPSLSQQIKKMEEKVAFLEDQLASIDIEKEMNSDLTSKQRRQEIVHLVNQFTLAMGQLASLEEQAIDSKEAL